MLTLLFYEPADVPPTDQADLEHVLRGVPGIDLGDTSRGHASGAWRDADTGAGCQIDIGASPLEEDTLHPATSYPGWRELPLVLHLPLAAPHWHCIESARLVERLMEAIPGMLALDTEDTRLADEADPGPFAWDRPRLLASWERQHAGWSEGSRLPRMVRRASLALWRYRRERRQGLAAHAEAAWPEALVLQDTDGGAARSAALWLDPAKPLALPPVELVVLRRDREPGALPVDELLLAAGGGHPLDAGQAVLITPNDRLRRMFVEAKVLPAARFRALGENDWTD